MEHAASAGVTGVAATHKRDITVLEPLHSVSKRFGLTGQHQKSVPLTVETVSEDRAAWYRICSMFAAMEEHMEYSELTQTDEYSPRPTEDPFTKTIEEFTASIPSSAYLGVAVAAMGVSFLCQVAGRGKWATFLLSGCRRGEGHDQTDRGGVSR